MYFHFHVLSFFSVPGRSDQTPRRGNFKKVCSHIIVKKCVQFSFAAILCIALNISCVMSPKNGDTVSNVNMVHAGGFLGVPNETVLAEYWDVVNKIWCAFPFTTVSSASPTFENVNGTKNDLYSWNMIINLNDPDIWTGPNTTGEARIRFAQGSFNLTSFDRNQVTYPEGSVEREVFFGTPPGQAGLNCASQTSPTINLLRNSGLTTVYLVRHAECDGVELNGKGWIRADALSKELIYAPLCGIITSDMVRTQQTADSIETRTGLTPIVVSFMNNPQIADIILNDFQGGNVLVVHHSNTIKYIISDLGVPQAVADNAPDIDTDDFDNFYTVHIPVGGGVATLTHRTYGAPSP